MNLILHREKQQPPADDCTLGLLFVGQLTLCTIERPWVPSENGVGGTKGVSCVPLGKYRLERHNTEAHPNTWALVNEELGVAHFPGTNPLMRTAVLIHPANFAHELRGCIAPGTRASVDEAGRHMVQESRKAMKMIQDMVPWTDDHTLEIR